MAQGKENQLSAPGILGRHWIVELIGCDPALLCDPGQLEQWMREAALAMGATIVLTQFHHFAPLGVSGVVVIQESHLTVHTWPEYHYAALDIFTCGDMEAETGIDLLAERLKAASCQTKLLKRGVF